MRPLVANIVHSLLKLDGRVISLDSIGDAVGSAPVTPNDIEEIFQALEAEGRQIERATVSVREHLGAVLAEARRLRQINNSSPSVQAIADGTGLGVGAVRAALLYASVLGR